MPLLLRRVHRAKWFVAAGEGQRPDDEVAAEDFEDPDNEVSVWEVDADRSNLGRIIAALEATRNFLADNFDYVLFDSVLATDLGIQVTKAHGDTPDHHANETWHHNLVGASMAQILALVHAIKALRPDDPATRLKGTRDVLPLLRQAIENGWMTTQQLSQDLQRKLGLGTG